MTGCIIGAALLKWKFVERSEHPEAECYHFRTKSRAFLEYEIIDVRRLEIPVPCSEAQTKVGYRRLVRDSVFLPGPIGITPLLGELACDLHGVFSIDPSISELVFNGRWRLLGSVALGVRARRGFIK